MKVLVLNSGSSSLKFQLFEMPEQKVLSKGLVERIGEEKSRFTAEKISVEQKIKNHQQALELITNYLLDKKNNLIQSKKDIKIIGHRIVHGGNKFVQPVIISKEVKEKIRELFPLAPLHNPANLTGIETAEKIFPNATQIGIFDTAFHQSIPLENHKYAIPEKFYKEGIRKYGFHGISHKYVSEKAIEKLSKKHSKLITLHLGNGASATAVLNGKSLDTSMGFGPMNGLIMGTRSGDIDQSVIFYLAEQMNYKLADIKNLLNKKSGMLALAGSNDLRDIENQANEGNSKAQTALKMYAQAIKKYIGDFTAKMNGLDALVFTAGIGENSIIVRKSVCDSMEFFGIKINDEKNQKPKNFNGEIHHKDSKVKIYVIPTNEELEIAKQSYELINNSLK